MTGRSELGFPKTSSVGNLKHRLVMTTLHNVRSKGHSYVDVREDGKKWVFFCTLCLAHCHSDSILFDHLNGKLHKERLVTAKATLLKSNPWPFSDGVFFFHDNPQEQNKSSNDLDSPKIKLLENHHTHENSLAIVSYGNMGQNTVTHTSLEIEDHANGEDTSFDSNLDGQGNTHELVIPAVLQNDEVSDLAVRHMGVGIIGARFIQMDGVPNEIRRIWCEWLGDKNFDSEDSDEVSEHDFAVVTFSYDFNLGRMSLFDGFKLLPPSSSHLELEDSGSTRGKKRKSFSDPGNMINQYESSGEESQSSNSSNVKLLLSGNDDQLVHTRIHSSKKMRKELREQQRVASERLCAICQQKMLPHKDVAALLNRKTGKFVCSSRNFTGAFHVFHISCLVHWVLVCEVEIYANQSVVAKSKRRSRRKTNRKGEAEEKHEMQEKKKQICSVFCPECQGTGMAIDVQLEKPPVPLSEIYRCKIKLCDAHKAWMKSPEHLEHCSVGFSFPLQSDERNEVQALCNETVSSLKLLHFYRANV